MIFKEAIIIRLVLLAINQSASPPGFGVADYQIFDHPYGLLFVSVSELEAMEWLQTVLSGLGGCKLKCLTSRTWNSVLPGVT